MDNDQEQRERDKASAQAYYERQQKKLKEATSSGDSSRIEHYEDKVKRVEKDFKREYNEYPQDNSGGSCRIS